MEIPFPSDVLPPSHIAVEHGVVTKISTLIPQGREKYDVLGTCSLCFKPIHSVSYQLNTENFMLILVANLRQQFVITLTDVTLNMLKIFSLDFFQSSELLRCSASEICKSHFHMQCLSKHALDANDEYKTLLFPIKGYCPKCGMVYLWGELIREQRILLAVSRFNSNGTLFNMVPFGKLIKI